MLPPALALWAAYGFCLIKWKFFFCEMVFKWNLSPNLCGLWCAAQIRETKWLERQLLSAPSELKYLELLTGFPLQRWGVCFLCSQPSLCDIAQGRVWDGVQRSSLFSVAVSCTSMASSAVWESRECWQHSGRRAGVVAGVKTPIFLHAQKLPVHTVLSA